MNPQYLIDQLELQHNQIVKLTELTADLKEHLMHLSAQVQSVTHRLNCVSDKLSDQAVLVQKIID